MDDVTNYMPNVGKPLKDQTFDIRVTYGELIILKAILQKPHPDYDDITGSKERFNELLNDVRFISNNAEDRANALRQRNKSTGPITD